MYKNAFKINRMTLKSQKLRKKKNFNRIDFQFHLFLISIFCFKIYMMFIRKNTANFTTGNTTYLPSTMMPTEN